MFLLNQLIIGHQSQNTRAQKNLHASSLHMIRKTKIEQVIMEVQLMTIFKELGSAR